MIVGYSLCETLRHNQHEPMVMSKMLAKMSDKIAESYLSQIGPDVA